MPVDERITTGDFVVVPSRLEPGQSCRVDYRGSSWTARNTGGNAIEAGSEARISQGVKSVVAAETATATG